jgi:hypothetical protein
MTPSPPGLAEMIEWATSLVKVSSNTDRPYADAILSTLRAHAELEADARRYRYMKRIVEGLKGVFSIHHVVGPKNILIMSVTSEHADEFIDRAGSK